MVLVCGTKDAVVPFAEVGFFLVEEMVFRKEEAVEVLEHEGGWWLLGWCEVDLIEGGLDGTVVVRVA